MKKIIAPMLIRITGLFLAFLFTVAVARVSGANSLGEYNYFLVIASFISMFLSFGTDNLILKEGNEGVFISSVVVKFILSFVIFIPLFILFIIINDFDTHWFVILFTAFLMSLISGGAHYLLRLKLNSLGNFYIEPLGCLIKLSLFMLLSLGGSINKLAIWSYIISICIVVLILYLHIFWSKLRGIRLWDETLKSISNFKVTLLYTRPFFVTSLGWFFISATDTFMISKMLDMGSVGIYNVVFRLVMMSSIMITVINSFYSSEFSDLFKDKDIEQLKYKFYKISLLLSLLAAGQFLVFWLFGKKILSVWGQEFISGYELLLVLMVGQTVNFITGMSAQLLNMTNGKKTVERITFIFVFINIPLNYILINSYGLIGAASATAISLGGMNLFYFILSRNMLNRQIIHSI